MGVCDARVALLSAPLARHTCPSPTTHHLLCAAADGVPPACRTEGGGQYGPERMKPTCHGDAPEAPPGSRQRRGRGRPRPPRGGNAQRPRPGGGGREGGAALVREGDGGTPEAADAREPRCWGVTDPGQATQHGAEGGVAQLSRWRAVRSRLPHHGSFLCPCLQHTRVHHL